MNRFRPAVRPVELTETGTAKRLLPLLAIAFALWGSLVAAEDAVTKPALSWLPTREAGLRDAQINKRPVLIRFEGDNCHWCRLLDEELAKPDAQEALKRWTLVSLDVARSAADARAFKVEAIPALRVLASNGRMMEWHDGYLAEEKLVEWLDASFEKANKGPDEVLLGSGPPSTLDVLKIIRQFGERNPADREAAIRRLVPYPKDAAEAVIEAMRREKLSVRLAALELLRAWKAPLDDIDPWRPETMTSERLSNFDVWLTTLTDQQETPHELTPDEWALARTEIDQLLTTDPTTAAAIRERLARYKQSLLPEVVARLKETSADDIRSRLLSLRYRLVMDDAMCLTSPGLVERLAAVDTRTRHQAVQELTEHAGAESQALFLELFTDIDPLVRELSLRGLRSAAGDDGTNALVKLLDDPEPNVRAAVLKLFAEEPWPGLQAHLTKFMEHETDPDLLVHAVRCFRKLKQRPTEVLLPLLQHAEWQVRAEVLDTITGAWQRFHNDETTALSNDKELSAALVGRLDDDDAFVVSRAIIGAKAVLTKDVILKLIAIPDKHPSLVKDVIATISTSNDLDDIARPALQNFFKSPDPTVRASAIHGLGELAPDEVQTELLAALEDQDRDVRIAGAETLHKILMGLKPKWQNQSWVFSNSFMKDDEVEDTEENEPADATVVANEMGTEPPRKRKSSQGSILSLGISILFGGGVESVEEISSNEPDEQQQQEDKLKNASRLGPKLDRWIVAFRAGKKRPAWLDTTLPPLEKMFASPDRSERIASSLPLIALGQDTLVLPTAIEWAQKGGTATLELIPIIGWLTFNERQPLIAVFVQRPHAAEIVPQLLSAVTELHDVRDENIFWNACDLVQSEPEHLQSIEHSLRQLHFGENYWNPESIVKSRRTRVYESVKKQLQSPRGWKQIVALSLMLGTFSSNDDDDKPEVVREFAQALADDEALDSKLRNDAFQIALAMMNHKERLSRLVELLSDSDSSRQLLALKFLVTDNQILNTLVNSHMSLNLRHEMIRMVSSDDVEDQLPAGVTVEVVRPLLASRDAETRALAGYLLAVLHDPVGLDHLLDSWRAKGRGDYQWDRLVYRAIAALDDSSKIPILKQIYKQSEHWNVRDFYRTIRSMTGPQILEFRAQIRAEKGAEALR